MKTLRIPSVMAGMLLLTSLGALEAQSQAQTSAVPQQAPSVADAARRARAQNRARTDSKVFTNEDMANLTGVISVVGTPPAEPAASANAATPAPEGTPEPVPANAAATAATTPAPAAGAAAGAAAAPVKDEAYWRQAFAGARKKLTDDSKELDILQREYNLKQQQFYSNPNVALREQTGRADLNKTLEEINTKKQDVAASQQAIATLEDDLRRAGGDAGWSRPPAQ